mgnify:CR=1 FL=1
MAIQLILAREFGVAKNENPSQGGYFMDWLTDTVEEAVLEEFERISARGGVLGAMERQYQRSKIQEESLFYESKKHTGELPIVGVNTFLSNEGSPTLVPAEVIGHPGGLQGGLGRGVHRASLLEHQAPGQEAAGQRRDGVVGEQSAEGRRAHRLGRRRMGTSDVGRRIAAARALLQPAEGCSAIATT